MMEVLLRMCDVWLLLQACYYTHSGCWPLRGELYHCLIACFLGCRSLSRSNPLVGVPHPLRQVLTFREH